MTKARSFAAYVASTVLLLVAVLLSWQFYLFMVQPLGPGSTVIVFNSITTRIWVVDLVVALLGVASFAGAIWLMVRRPRRPGVGVAQDPHPF